MLGGKISNQDEDEVEGELEAMEMELSGKKLPDAPLQKLPEVHAVDLESERRKQAESVKTREAEEPMLA